MTTENLNNHNEAPLLALGFDDAILGYEMNSMRAVYSKDKMVEILMKDMSEEDAVEFLTYNVWGAYVGKQTPIYIDEMDGEELISHFQIKNA